MTPRLVSTSAASLMTVLLATLAGAAQPAWADGLPLGRLFSTPQERAQLDARRNGSVADPMTSASQAAAAAAAAAAVAAAVPPQPLQLDGVVQRSGGKSTIWVNQAPLAASDGKLLDNRSVVLRLPSGKRVILKPGQTYDEATDTIHDAGR
ncbi:MAG: hypothetical protein V4724_03760 [Pseudomonadota bacterium]